MYSIMICDDDLDSLTYIKNGINELGYLGITEPKTFNTAERLLFYLEEEQKEDIIFILDIELEAYSGIDLAKKILQRCPHGQIIFTSGFDQYFIDVYQVEHIYFLPKPLDLLQLKYALDKAVLKIKDLEENIIVVNNHKGVCKVELKDIFYIEKNRRLVRLFLSGKQDEISFYGKIEDIENNLTDDFVRCHHSYFVNLDKVVRIENMQVLLSNGVFVPISQSKYKLVRKIFLAYLAEKMEKGRHIHH